MASGSHELVDTSYAEFLDAIDAYYGDDAIDIWREIGAHGVTAENVHMIKDIPGVEITYSRSGKYLGYSYTNPFRKLGIPASSINSNVETGMYGAGSFSAQVPGTAVTNAETGMTTMESGAKVVSTGAKVAAIADKASLAVIGVSPGTKLGKLIGETIYNVNPDWWDEHYPTINPETWDNMASSETGKNIIRTIFGLENDSATMYVDERMLAYTYMTLLENGAYSKSGTVKPPEEVHTIPQFKNYEIEKIYYGDVATFYRSTDNKLVTSNVENNTSPVYVGFCQNEGNFGFLMSVSENPFKINNSINSGDFPAKKVVINDHTYYTGHTFGYGLADAVFTPPLSIIRLDSTITSNADLWGYAVLYGVRTPAGIEGIEANPDATIDIVPDSLINPVTGKPVTPQDNPADVLQALKTQYPGLFDGAIYEDIPQPDGNIERITYIPTPYPNTDNPTKPITDDTPGVNPQTNVQINPDTRTPELLQQLVNILTTPAEPPETGSGDSPSAIIPAGTANALYSIYNPTQAELNSFGAWLWSNNFVDQLLKLFNDPMQAIIGLHKVFAQPGISGKSNIKVGYLDSGVPSNVVSEQYTTIDCGTVSVREYFGNVFDYDPFTQVYIYLPFIGIEKLDTGDIMRSAVNVIYNIDVLTGACLAEIRVSRDASGGTIYTFAGNCAVQYPISSGSYMGIVASLASVAGGVVGTIASGGALAPVAMGAAAGVLNAHTRVQHSGGFSGNAGAMGIKKPYLIITRPQTCLADTFPTLDGYPANKSTTICDCSGFVKCKSCHVENVSATDAELSEIESLLKSGIII